MTWDEIHAAIEKMPAQKRTATAQVCYPDSEDLVGCAVHSGHVVSIDDDNPDGIPELTVE